MVNNKKVTAIVQARVTSTRLPGKVLMKIEKMPLLWHVVERLKHAKKNDEIILAIPDTKENDQLEQFAKRYNIKYFRGSENDVLDRFYQTASKFQCENIVRITADNPFIDPKILDIAIKNHLNKDADYSATKDLPQGLNLEIFDFNTLEKTHYSAKDPYEREHVTPYIYRHPETFKLNNVAVKKSLQNKGLRLTVDTQEDAKLAKKVYGELYTPGNIFHLPDILHLFEKNTQLS